MSAPGRIAPGTRIKDIVEAVDFYPTLAEMAGVQTPKNLQGLSFVPLFLNPDRTWKQAAFAQQQRIASLTRGNGDLMGYTVRTAGFRYTAWVNSTNAVVGKELYDLTTDPNETTNVAANAKYVTNVTQLETMRLNGWKAVRDQVHP